MIDAVLDFLAGWFGSRNVSKAMRNDANRVFEAARAGYRTEIPCALRDAEAKPVRFTSGWLTANNPFPSWRAESSRRSRVMPAGSFDVIQVREPTYRRTEHLLDGIVIVELGDGQEHMCDLAIYEEGLDVLATSLHLSWPAEQPAE